jgi:modification methylase
LKRNFIGIEKESEYISLAKKRIDAIKVFFTESDWVEDGKEKKGRVPFETLLKEQIIKVGEPLHTRKTYSATAFVLSDGRLEYKKQVGSIHRIGALIQQTLSCNGWKFWYIIRDNKSVLIDDLRNDYLRRRHGV